jgi:hypothetical protein
MGNYKEAKAKFNQRLEELQKEIEPSLNGHNLKEIVIYEKLLDIQEQINKLELKSKKL